MSRTKHLPLYRATYAFAREIYRIKIKLPKSLKHDLGQAAFSSSILILKGVVIANSAKDKSTYLARLLIEVEVQWALLRLLFDLRGISAGEFKVLSEQLNQTVSLSSSD